MNIGSCYKLTNIGIQIISDHCYKYLETLNLGGLNLIDYDVSDVCKKCVLLKHLDLRACCKLTNNSLKYIGLLSKKKYHKKLSSMVLLDFGTFHTNTIPPQYRSTAAQKIIHVQYLSVQFSNNQFNSLFFQYLMIFFFFFFLGGCDRFDDDGFKLLFYGGKKNPPQDNNGQRVKFFKNLESLDLRGITKITDDALNLICNECCGMDSNNNNFNNSSNKKLTYRGSLKALIFKKKNNENITNKIIGRLKQYKTLKVKY